MKSNSRIALFVPSLNGGGAERVMVLLANGIAERGYSVDLVTLCSEGAYRGEVSPDVNVVDLSAKRMLLSIFPLFRYLRKFRPFALVSALDYANIIAVCAQRLSLVATRVVVTEHSTLSISNANDARGLGRLVPFLMRHFYRHAHGILAVSSGVADDLARVLNLDRQAVRVAYNPVVTERMISRSYEIIDHPWLADGQQPFVLAAGRLTGAKDFPTLIRAFKKLRDTDDVRLVILGEGPQREQLEKLVAELKLEGSVLLPGFSGDPYAWMRRSALFVLSSAWEGFGNVLVEAMACGTPVVSTNCPSGPAEILENGKWGRLVPVGDANALAKAMHESLADGEPPSVITRSRRFDVSNAVDEYLAAIHAD